ncbi:Ger(x)C family spore germination protein [Paenibacillus massiliensis]|uniref:Ger(x)C family spore germination protein n=1 Tax=Paenibacillus massiliensis TaxID=225917 RepID=UPI00037A768C|nr:Ger(x)C family spore germination protein [Paenibacillus massiliensis]
MSWIRRVGCTIIVLAVLLTVTGCWSSREIEDLSVYLGLGIDTPRETPLEKYLTKEGAEYPKQNNITATVQIAPGHVKSTKSAEEGSNTSNKSSYSNEQLTGDSLLQIFRHFALLRDRPLIGHHLKVIVISKDVAKKYRLDQLLDFVLRDNDIRLNCLVLLSHERALDVLTLKDQSEVPAFYLTGMVNNSYLINKILEPMTLAKLDAKLKAGSSFLLQNVVSFDGDDKFSGAGIFSGKTTKYIGALSQTDLEGLAWINLQSRAGIVKTYNKEGYTVVYETKKNKTTITPTVRGQDISFHVNVESEGWLMEDWIIPETEEKGAYLKELEKDFADIAEQQIEQVLHKLQRTYKVDVADFGEVLRIKEPKVWKQVKDNWDEVFSESKITYKVKVKVTSRGSSTK